MKIKSIAWAGLGLMLLASPAAANNTDPIVIYPYASRANYCPAGLQPVTTNGVICCGNPTAGQSYQDALRHPAQRYHVKRHYRARMVCPVGEKGCYSR